MKEENEVEVRERRKGKERVKLIFENETLVYI